MEKKPYKYKVDNTKTTRNYTKKSKIPTTHQLGPYTSDSVVGKTYISTKRVHEERWHGEGRGNREREREREREKTKGKGTTFSVLYRDCSRQKPGGGGGGGGGGGMKAQVSSKKSHTAVGSKQCKSCIKLVQLRLSSFPC